MTYAAALYLTLSNTLFFPSSTDPDTEKDTDTDRTYSHAAHAILDELVLSGNRVAAARKRELSRIEALFDEFARRVQREGLRLLTLSDQGLTDATQLDVDIHTPVEIRLGTADTLQVPSLGATGSTGTSTLFHGHANPGPGTGTGPVDPVDPAAAPASVEFLESIGISSYEFLSIVEQIDHPGISYGELDVRPDLLGAEDGTGTGTGSFG